MPGRQIIDVLASFSHCFLIFPSNVVFVEFFQLLFVQTYAMSHNLTYFPLIMQSACAQSLRHHIIFSKQHLAE